MAGREMLFGEGPAACPFVALESDRDRRLAEPDHRHRCYAEPEPEPRAIAHQRAYCLSSSFPACPIFQDWAVRAAARPLSPPAGAAATVGGVNRPTGWPQEGADQESARVGEQPPPVGEPPPPVGEPPVGGPAWAARPPWLGREEVAAPEPEQMGAFDASADTGMPGPFDAPAAAVDPAEQAQPPAYLQPPSEPPPPSPYGRQPGPGAPPSPEAIERLPSLPIDATGDPERDAQVESERQRRLEEDRQRRADEERLRRAEDERRERERRASAAAAVPPFLAGRPDQGSRAADAPLGPSAPPPPPRASQGPPPPPPRASQGSPSPPHSPQTPLQPPRQQARGSQAEWSAKREDLVPIWEREPIHAYPTLRRRIGMGGGGDILGTITALLAILAIIALVAFVVIAGPAFLGGGAAGPGRTQPPVAGVSPTAPTGQATPVVTAAPPQTPTPGGQPTPRTYTVQAGDTLFGISEQFGLTVEQLLAANPEIVNADYVTIGQVIIIPEADFSPPPAASPAPGTP